MPPSPLRPAATRRPGPRLWRLAALAAAWLPLAASAAESFVGRPIYDDPNSGLQLPPGCEVEPSWRAKMYGSDLELWVAQCTGLPRVWLLKRQVVEVYSARKARLRFQVLDERTFSDETAGESLSVQCTGPSDESGYVVHGARWRTDNKEMRLKSAKGVLKADTQHQLLADAEVATVDCVRFPEREAMLKRLQQH